MIKEDGRVGKSWVFTSSHGHSNIITIYRETVDEKDPKTIKIDLLQIKIKEETTARWIEGVKEQYKQDS